MSHWPFVVLCLVSFWIMSPACAATNRLAAVCAQVINREERPYYEITTGEHIKYVTPEDATKVIFKKIRGSF